MQHTIFTTYDALRWTLWFRHTARCSASVSRYSDETAVSGNGHGLLRRQKTVKGQTGEPGSGRSLVWLECQCCALERMPYAHYDGYDSTL